MSSNNSKSKSKTKSKEWRNRRDIKPGEESVTQVIGFLDIDSFECQVWQRELPETRGLPCVVVTASGRILAATPEAKARGINRKDSPTLKEARAKCKHLTVFRKGEKYGKQDNTKCRRATWEIVCAILEFLQLHNCKNVAVELASSDEIYLDLSGEVSREIDRWRRKFGGRRERDMAADIVWERKRGQVRGPFKYILPTNPVRNSLGMSTNPNVYSNKNEERLMFGGSFMSLLCQHVFFRTGLLSSAGVAKNKLLAKLGCGINKPRRITVLHDVAFPRITRTLPITSIPGLGGEVGERLRNNLNCETAHKVRQMGHEVLEREFGVEKAQQIWSWVSGSCNDPVVNRLWKEGMRINKPAQDITNPDKLLAVLKDMTCEIVELLDEEAVRRCRRTDEVRLVYKFGVEADVGGTVMLDISSKEKLDDLPTTAMEFLTNLPEFNGGEFQITVLGMILTNFVNLTKEKDSSDTDTESTDCTDCSSISLSSELNLSIMMDELSLENLFVPAHATMKVFSKMIPATASLEEDDDDEEDENPILLPTFKHENIDAFRITRSLEYCKASFDQIPQILPKDNLYSMVGVDMLNNFNEPVSCSQLLKDYISYDETKITFFHRWWVEEGRKMETLKNIKFVAAHGRIIRALKTPVNKTYGNWETYAMNVDGVIYLWDEKTPRNEITYTPEGSYIGALFEHLVTGRMSQAEIGDSVDAFDKIFPIQKVTFGEYEMLLLSNVDAQDEEDGLVQVQLTTDEACYTRLNTAFLLERNLKLWAQSVVSGAETIVLGKKDTNKKITGIQVLKTDNLPENEHREVCFEFLHRLLCWMDAQMPVTSFDEHRVRKFSWIPGKKIVESNLVPEQLFSKLLLPRIFHNTKTA